MKKIIFLCILLTSLSTFSQIQGGAGINLGYKNTGVEMQGYFYNRGKLVLGLNLNRFDSYSSKVGAGISMFNLKNKHNLWINSSIEYKFSKTTTLEKEGVYYNYFVNNLNYLNYSTNYSLKFNSNENKRNFFLLEVEFFYRQLINQVHLVPSTDNIQISNKFESDIRKFYRSGVGVSVGVKFIF